MVGNREGEERVGMEQRERIKRDGKGMARGRRVRKRKGEIGYGKGSYGSTWISVQRPPSS